MSDLIGYPLVLFFGIIIGIGWNNVTNYRFLKDHKKCPICTQKVPDEYFVGGKKDAE